MVLHNDKWKHKAKRAVERKHRQQAQKKGENIREGDSQKEGHFTNNLEIEKDNDDENSKTDVSLSDSNEENETEESSYKKLESNEWRFADPIVDETILKDPEYIQQLENARIEEENRMKAMRETVVENLKDKIEKYDDELFLGSKELKEKKNLKLGSLSNWSVGDDSEGDDNDDDHDGKNTNSTGKSDIREFTEEEKLKFLELQRKIKHQKDLEQMKAKIDRANHKDIRNQVLEIHGDRGKENYRSLVDKNLEKVGRTDVNLEQHDKLVEQMLGVNLHDNPDSETFETFDIDTLIKSKPSKEKVVDKVANEHKCTPLVQLDDLDEDFLESIL